MAELMESNKLNENIMSLQMDNQKRLEVKKKLMMEINQFKEQKKQTLVKSVLSEFLGEEKVLSVFFGKVEIVPYEF